MGSTSLYWEHVTKLCAYIEPLIAQSYKEALDEFNASHRDTMYLYNKSDMASNMHAHVRGRVRINFRNLSWAHIIDDPGKAFMLLINGSVVGIPIFLGIKFKKQGYGFRTANIQTESVKHFNSQQIEYMEYLPHIQVALPLTGMKDKVKNPPKGNNIVAGYTPETTWAGFKKCAFTFPFGGRNVKLISEITVLEFEQEVLNQKEEAPKTDRVRRRLHIAKKQEPRKFIAAAASGEQKAEEKTAKKKKGNE